MDGASLLASLAAWVLPALGFWILVAAWGVSFAAWRAVLAYAASTLLAAVTLSPGGVVVTGERLLGDLAGAGVAPAAAALLVLGIRLATAGLATALGLVFLLVHVRTQTASIRHATSTSWPIPTTSRFPPPVGRRSSPARRR